MPLDLLSWVLVDVIRLEQLLLQHLIVTFLRNWHVGAKALVRDMSGVVTASPRYTRVAIHEQRVDGLLATIDGTHHEPIDLAVDEDVWPVQLVLLVRAMDWCASVLVSGVLRLLPMGIAVS